MNKKLKVTVSSNGDCGYDKDSVLQNPKLTQRLACILYI